MPFTIPEDIPECCQNCNKHAPTVYCRYCQKFYCAYCDAAIHADGRKRKHPRYALDVDKTDIITCALGESAALDYTGDVFVYGTFTVKEDGDYILTNQCSVSAAEDTRIETIQHGVCLQTLKDIDKCIDSQVVSATLTKDTTVTNTMTAIKHLRTDREYVAWLNVLSANNANVLYSKKFSSLRLKKI